MTTGDAPGEATGAVPGGQSAGPAADDQAVVFYLWLYVAGQSPKSSDSKLTAANEALSDLQLGPATTMGRLSL